MFDIDGHATGKPNSYFFRLGEMLPENARPADLSLAGSLFERSKAPLLEFVKDGRRARFDIVDGKAVFGGNVEWDEAAKLMFEAFARIAVARAKEAL